MNRGTWYAIGAYGIWGLFPIYWKVLHRVPALQLISHRVVWSSLVLFGVLLVSRQLRHLRDAVGDRRALGLYSASAVLIGANWLVYIWSVNAGFIVEASLGYFINPLFSVLLGVIVLRERLRSAQWLPIGIATAGVLHLAFTHGSVPWIALALAATFGSYGLIKKISPLGSLHGLALETGLLFPVALLHLLIAEAFGTGVFLHQGAGTDLLLAGAGFVSTVPLLLFSSAARRIPLSQIGILQYLSPTLQFLIGVFLYREPFGPAQLTGFTIVWVALGIFAVEGFIARRKNPGNPPASETSAG